MTGPLESVIGVRTDIILRRFLTEMPQQFEVADGPVRINAASSNAQAGGRRPSSRSSVVCRMTSVAS